MSAFSRKFNLQCAPLFVRSFWRVPEGVSSLYPNSGIGYELIVGTYSWDQLLTETNVISESDQVREEITEFLAGKKIFPELGGDKVVRDPVVKGLILRLKARHYNNQALLLANCNCALLSGKHLKAYVKLPSEIRIWLESRAFPDGEEYEKPVFRYVKDRGLMQWPHLVETVSDVLIDHGQKALADQFRRECKSAKDLNSGIDVSLNYVTFRAITGEEERKRYESRKDFGHYCRLTLTDINMSQDGKGFSTEGLSQEDLIDSFQHIKTVSGMGWTVDSDGIDHYTLKVKRVDLKNFVLLYAPFVLRSIEFSGKDICLDYMRSVLRDVFPKSGPLLDGHGITDPKSNIVSLMKMILLWETFADEEELSNYVWECWLSVVGQASYPTFRGSRSTWGTV